MSLQALALLHTGFFSGSQAQYEDDCPSKPYIILLIQVQWERTRILFLDTLTKVMTIPEPAAIGRGTAEHSLAHWTTHGCTAPQQGPQQAGVGRAGMKGGRIQDIKKQQMTTTFSVCQKREPRSQETLNKLPKFRATDFIHMLLPLHNSPQSEATAVTCFLHILLETVYAYKSIHV